jgi:uncharacterized SAM-binding protein YcdF (DUF218 family)
LKHRSRLQELRSFLEGKRKFLSAVFFLLVGCLLGVLTVGLISAGDLYDYQDSVDGVHLPQVEVIVVLGGGRGRIAAAGDVWYRYWELAHPGQRAFSAPSSKPAVDKAQDPPVLYLAGMGPQSSFQILSKQMRSGVRDMIHARDVIIENESLNTVENAWHFARYAQEKGWTKVLLITSRYHMKRAKFLFEGFFWALERPIDIETLSVYQEPFEPGEWRKSLNGMEVTLIEYLKWVGYRNFWRPEVEAMKRLRVSQTQSHAP